MLKTINNTYAVENQIHSEKLTENLFSETKW